MPVSPMIDMDNAELTLPSAAGDVLILRGISLKINSGESVSVVGPSGAGKSSLMMLAAGLEKPTGGRVSVAGTVLNGLDEDRLALFRRRHIGVVFQDFHLIPSMTALENVAVPLELSGEKDARERAAACLEQVGLRHRLLHYPSQLSGGEQQRVAVARAFAPRPEILLADEPTGNLDGPTGQKITELLFGLQRQNGTTMMLITHDRTLAALCERTIRIRDGRIDPDGGEDS
ncbi:MAG: ABC transporter ATP-binding protein [Alphaproteobacteria bacterium]